MSSFVIPQLKTSIFSIIRSLFEHFTIGSVFNCIHRTLERLQLDYIDLYLIHWPVPRDAEPYWRELNISTWDAMEELYHSGRIRAIGVSNFDKRHIDNIMLHSNIKPMVNQIEIQPAYQQRPLIDYCKKNGICVEAWGPLKQGEVFQIEELKEMSSRYGKTVSQLCLRFCIQLNTLPIVKCREPVDASTPGTLLQSGCPPSRLP